MKRKQKHYINNDGNGGVNISKSMMALITLLTILLTIVASVVAYSTTFSNKLGYLTDKVINCEDGNNKASEHLNKIDIQLSRIEIELKYISASIADL